MFLLAINLALQIQQTKIEDNIQQQQQQQQQQRSIQQQQQQRQEKEKEKEKEGLEVHDQELKYELEESKQNVQSQRGFFESLRE